MIIPYSVLIKFNFRQLSCKRNWNHLELKEKSDASLHCGFCSLFDKYLVLSVFPNASSKQGEVKDFFLQHECKRFMDMSHSFSTHHSLLSFNISLNSLVATFLTGSLRIEPLTTCIFLCVVWVMHIHGNR